MDIFYQTGKADNDGVAIHFYHTGLSEDSVPLVIIPGMVNTADEVRDAIGGKLRYPHLLVSLRGRGQSDSPESGYTLDDQAKDVLAALDHAGVKKFFVFGHSVGSTVGIRVAAMRPAAVQGIIMGDFAPFYPPFDANWGEMVLAHYAQITRIAVDGLVREAAYQDVLKDLNSIEAPVLVLRAGKQDTALPVENAQRLQQLCPRCEIVVIEESGHELLHEAPDATLHAIVGFLGRA